MAAALSTRRRPSALRCVFNFIPLSHSLFVLCFFLSTFPPPSFLPGSSFQDFSIMSWCTIESDPGMLLPSSFTAPSTKPHKLTLPPTTTTSIIHSFNFIIHKPDLIIINFLISIFLIPILPIKCPISPTILTKLYKFLSKAGIL